MKIIAIIVICCLIKCTAYSQIAETGITQQGIDFSPPAPFSTTTSPDCTGRILLADSCVKTGANFQINASFPINAVQWNFGDGNTENNNVIAHHPYTTTGTYTVRATVRLGCGTVTLERTFDIIDCNGNASCPANILFSDSCLGAGAAFTIKATNPVQDVLWNFDDSLSGASNTVSSINSTHIFSALGNYRVSAQVHMGCGTDTLFRTITIVTCDTPITTNCKLYVPTAFTPNGDRQNDNFRAFSTCTLAEYELLIFNRWGEQVYSTRTITDRWDGSFKGHKSPVGGYVYVVNYQVVGQAKKTERGNLFLLR